jgi:type IV pilus assembly protein PilN
MIKINLIGDRRPAVARRARPKMGMGGGNQSLLLLGAGTLLGLLVAGAWWWMLNSKLEEEQARVNRAREEVQQLEKILKEVEQFKKQKADLTTRINVIKQLTLAQRGPVAIMDGVSRALPDLLWLQTMVVDSKSVTVTGQAMNTNAIAAFIENLSQVPEFREPDTRDIEQTSVEGQPIFRFSLSFPYILQSPEEKPAAGAEAAAKPAAPGPA